MPSTKVSAVTCGGERLLRGETDLLKVESSHLGMSLQERRLGKMALQTSVPVGLAAPGQLDRGKQNPMAMVLVSSVYLI